MKGKGALLAFQEILGSEYGLKVPFLDLVFELSSKHGVHPALVLAVMKAESGFDPLALSPKGAMGLMQLMPETARELGVRYPFDPYQNLEAGIRYLKKLLERFGDPLLALAAYNCGPQRVLLSGGIPAIPETVRFVQKVVGYLREFLKSFGWSSSDKGEGPFPKEEITLRSADGRDDLMSLLGTKEKKGGESVALRSTVFSLPGGQKLESRGKSLTGENTDLRSIPSVLIQRHQEAEKKGTSYQIPVLSERVVRDLLTATSVGPKEGGSEEDKGLDGGLWALLLQAPGEKDKAFPSGIGTKAPLMSQGVQLKEMVGELVQRVRLELQKGAERVEVELKPLVLGGVKVEVKKEGEGLSTHITAYTEGARRILEAHLSEVQKAFEAQGLKVTNLTLELSQMGEPSRRYGQRDRQRREEERRLSNKDQRVFEVVV